MAKVINFLKAIRRNWKKSTLLFGVLAYGSSYGIERYQTFQMMRAYCEEAKVFGEKVVPRGLKPKHVTVILNPEANNKKSNVQFEKFAAPLLHLAGFKVSMFQTENEKQAGDLMEVMANTDAVLVAGGDGTLHEVVTGLMRRPGNEDEYLPLGIIPAGKTNTVAKHLFGSKSSSHAQLMAEAVMAVIRDKMVSLDVMKIKYANEVKPIYAVSSFEQGVFAEVEPKVQKYWYFGGLKDKFTYFVNAFKDHSPISYLQLQYVAPCEGCSKCYIPPKIKEKNNYGGRWWSAFVPKKADVKTHEALPDYSKVVNEECDKSILLESSFSNFSIYTSSIDQSSSNQRGRLWIKMYPKNMSFNQFLTSGLNHRKSKLQSSASCNIVNAREVKIEIQKSSENKNEESEKIKVEIQKSSDDKNEEGQEINAEIRKLSEDKNEESEEINIGIQKSSEDKNEGEKSIHEEPELYCYVDKEKYKMSSCDITLIPKRVNVYG